MTYQSFESWEDARMAFMEGRPVFAFHEMDEEEPVRVTSLEMLQGFTYDQLYTTL